MEASFKVHTYRMYVPTCTMQQISTVIIRTVIDTIQSDLGPLGMYLHTNYAITDANSIEGAIS